MTRKEQVTANKVEALEADRILRRISKVDHILCHTMKQQLHSSLLQQRITTGKVDTRLPPFLSLNREQFHPILEYLQENLSVQPQLHQTEGGYLGFHSAPILTTLWIPRYLAQHQLRL
jgi:hypothetical protein